MQGRACPPSQGATLGSKFGVHTKATSGQQVAASLQQVPSTPATAPSPLSSPHLPRGLPCPCHDAIHVL